MKARMIFFLLAPLSVFFMGCPSKKTAPPTATHSIISLKSPMVSSPYNQAKHIATDNNRNFYVLGDFSTSLLWDGLRLTCEGRSNAYFGKFDEAGTCLWLKQFKGVVSPSSSCEGRAITTDKENNICSSFF